MTAFGIRPSISRAGSHITDHWKDAGVVDRDGLENRCTLTGTQGSNPCLSAINQAKSAVSQ